MSCQRIVGGDLDNILGVVAFSFALIGIGTIADEIDVEDVPRSTFDTSGQTSIINQTILLGRRHTLQPEGHFIGRRVIIFQTVFSRANITLIE